MNASILVAGKSAQNHHLVKGAFADTDINIVRATTMSLSLFLAQKNAPFLIIADTDLVDGDAEAFLQAMKSDRELNHIPVVFLSTSASENKRTALLKMGAAEVLKQPTHAQDLLVQIGPWLQTQNAGRALSMNETTE